MKQQRDAAIKKFLNLSCGIPSGEVSLVMSGRASGKSNSQSMMIEYLNQQIKEVNEYKSKGYIPIYLDSNSATRKEMIEWCKENCKCHYYVAGQLFMFEDETDAMTFGLVW